MYESPPEIEPICEEKLMARQLMLKYFQNDFKLNLRYYKDFGDYTIAEMDQVYRRKRQNVLYLLIFR